MNRTGFIRMVVACLALQSSGLQASDWHTFHGDFSLSGVSADVFAAKPRRLWRTRVGKGLGSPVVGGNGRLFCIADGETVTALNTAGGITWSRIIKTVPTGNGAPVSDKAFVAPPLYVGKELLVVVSEEGDVHGLDPKDGKDKWVYSAGAEIHGAPGYAPGTGKGHGRVVVVTRAEGILHAVHAGNGNKLWVSEPLGRTDGHIAVADQYVFLGNCAAAFFAMPVANGTDVLTVQVGEECEMAGGIAVADGMAYAGNRSGSFAGADLKNDRLLWLNEDSEEQLSTTPAVTGERVIFCGGDAVVYALERKTGKKIWSYDTGGMEPVSPLITGDGVIAVVDGTLYGLGLADGKLRWKLDIGDAVETPSVVDGMLVIATDDGYVTAYGYPASQKNAAPGTVDGSKR